MVSQKGFSGLQKGKRAATCRQILKIISSRPYMSCVTSKLHKSRREQITGQFKQAEALLIPATLLSLMVVQICSYTAGGHLARWNESIQCQPAGTSQKTGTHPLDLKNKILASIGSMTHVLSLVLLITHTRAVICNGLNVSSQIRKAVKLLYLLILSLKDFQDLSQAQRLRLL